MIGGDAIRRELKRRTQLRIETVERSAAFGQVDAPSELMAVEPLRQRAHRRVTLRLHPCDDRSDIA